MYIGDHFGVDSAEDHLVFMRKNSFALVISVEKETPFMTHLPLIPRFEDGRFTLIGHLAKKNVHSQHLEGARAWCVFTGPQSYISSKWYSTQNEIPTWNYEALHCSGEVKTFEEENELKEHLLELIECCEKKTDQPPVKIDPFHPKHRPMLKEILGFKIEVDQIQHKRKLNQNLSAADRQGACEALAASRSCSAIELSKEMKKYAFK